MRMRDYLWLILATTSLHFLSILGDLHFDSYTALMGVACPLLHNISP